MARRLALLIGNSKFNDAGTFPELRTPGNDARDFADVLEKHGNFEIVGVCLDEDARTIQIKIEDFYKQAKGGDLALLYYSGHGYKDVGGILYLVTKGTQTDRLLTTGVRDSFIDQAMEYSKSKHRIIILDCCFSGAFIKDTKSGAGRTEALALEKLTGHVTALLASSSMVQYSFQEEGRNSLFTKYLLEGIETGDADENGDGYISVDELFEYVDPKVRETRREQTPMKQVTERGARIYIARNPNPPDPTITGLSPEGTPLTLRSFVIQGLPASDWLKPLDIEATRGWIREFEEAGDETIEASEQREKGWKRARLLLGISNKHLPIRPASADFGRLTWLAAAHPNPVWRETAVLALIEGYGTDTLARVEAAIREGGLSRWRLAELRAILSDANSEIEIKIREKTREHRRDRLEIWWWRVRRRVIRDRHRIFWPMVGGGIGAGLALGLLRGAIGALAGMSVGIQFAVNFWWAWILGAALSLGIALAGPLMLGQSEKGEATPPMWRALLHPDRLPAVLAVCLGTIFFGLAHLLVAWFNGLSLSKAPLVAPVGFVAGLGLSLGLYAQPRAGWRLGLRGWLPRLGAAALTLVLTQLIFILAENKGPGIAIAWTANFYRATFTSYEMPWWQQFMSFYPQWPKYLALLDAALLGIVLTIGITAGLLLAEDWLKRWRDLNHQSDD